MMNRLKRIIALVMAVMMMVTSMPVNALADDTTGTPGVLPALDYPNFVNGIRLEKGIEKWYSTYGFNYINLSQMFAESGAPVSVVENSGKATQVADPYNSGAIYTFNVLLRSDEEYTGSISFSNLITSEGSVYTNNTATVTVEVAGNANQTPVSSYNITFNSNGGSGNMDSATVSADNNNYTLPTTCNYTRDGYTFKGWAYNATDTEVLSGSIIVDKDLTLYAIWQETETEDPDNDPEIDSKYESLDNVDSITMTVGQTRYFTCVSFHGPAQIVAWDGGGLFTVSEENLISGSDDSKVYTFALTANAETNGRNMRLGAREANINFIVNAQPEVQYEVKFNVGEGATGTMASVTSGTSYTLPSLSSDVTPPAGKRFAGWLVNDGTETQTAGTPITLIGDTTLTAVWEDVVTVTYGDDNYTESVAKGSPVTLVTLAETGIEIPSDEQYFAGWKVGEETKQPGDPVTVEEDVTISPIWGTKVTVSYDLNGVEGVGYDAVKVIPGATVTLPADPVREEYKFLGWSETKVDEPYGAFDEVTTELVSSTYIVSNDAEDGSTITLHAVWQALPDIVPVSFMTGTDAEVDAITDKRQGEEITLPADLVRDGFQFLGWSEEYVADMEQVPEGASYLTGNYTINQDATELTFNAVWVKTYRLPLCRMVLRSRPLNLFCMAKRSSCLMGPALLHLRIRFSMVGSRKACPLKKRIRIPIILPVRSSYWKRILSSRPFLVRPSLQSP